MRTKMVSTAAAVALIVLAISFRTPAAPPLREVPIRPSAISPAACASDPDRCAWLTLADISTVTNIGATPATPPQTPLTWRLWATADEVFAKQPTVPASGEFPTARDLSGCGAQLQNQAQTLHANVGNSTQAALNQCEVVFLNPSVAQYVQTNGFYIRENVMAAAKGPGTFPIPDASAREIKTDWRPLGSDQTDFITATLTDQSGTGQPYELVAFHMRARTLPNGNWLWATWIHESLLTGATKDSFGLDHGKPSAALLEVLSPAKLEILEHYRLIGTQTDFRNPKRLGNPLIEGLKDPTLKYSSCMGCHQWATIEPGSGVWSVPDKSVALGKQTVNTGTQVDFNYSLAARSQCKGNQCTTAVKFLDRNPSGKSK